MILKTLQLANYKQFGTLDLEFREGLVGIIGRNGAGKSTILEAVLYALYGKDEIKNKELIRSSFADPKAPVQIRLDFLVQETLFSVRRELRGKKLETVGAELYKNDALIAKGATAVNDEVTRLLKLDREAFKRSVFSGQKELTELSDTKGQERAKMVRRMLGLEHLDDIQSAVSADLRGLKSQIAGQEQLLLEPSVLESLGQENAESEQKLQALQKRRTEAQEQLETLEKSASAAKNRFETEAAKQARHHAAQQALTQWLERKNASETQRNQLQQKRAALQEQQRRLEADRPEMQRFAADQEQLRAMEAERQKQVNLDINAGKLKTLEPGIQQASEKLEQLQAQIAQLEPAESEYTRVEAQLTELRSRIEAKRLEFNNTRAEMGALDERIRERKTKLEQLQQIGREGTCPTCFQPVLDAYDSVLSQLDRELSELQQTRMKAQEERLNAIAAEGTALRETEKTMENTLRALGDKRARLYELQRQKKASERENQDLQAQMHRLQVVIREIGPVRFDVAVYETLKTRISAAEPRYLEFQKDENYLQREIPATETHIEHLQKQEQEAAGQIARCEADLQQTGFDEAVYAEAQNILTGFNQSLTQQGEALRALMSASYEIGTALEKRRETLQQQAQIRAQIAGKQAEAEALDKLGRMLQQFKMDILERVGPGISREASLLFSRITKGRYESIRVDENFEFSIADGGIYYPIERFSGGEIDLANFCLRIAVTKAIMELSGSGQSVEFLAFDEIFGSQDEERRYEIMLALHYLQEQFRQIFIVSHIETQKDFFPNILEVSGSTVRYL